MAKQSSEDRDLAGLKKLRAASQSEVDDEVTAPHDLINLEKYENDAAYRREMNALSERYDLDPAFRVMWKLMRVQRKEANRTLGTVSDVAMEAKHDVSQIKEISETLDDVVQWKARVDTSLALAKWVMGFVLAATLGSIIVIATKIYTWGVSSGELEIRLLHLERSMDRRSSSPFTPASAIVPAAVNTTTRNP